MKSSNSLSRSWVPTKPTPSPAASTPISSLQQCSGQMVNHSRFNCDSNSKISGARARITVSHRMSKLISAYPWISRLRIPMIAPHGIEGVDCLSSGEILVAASPTISISLIKERASIRSLMRSLRLLPSAKERASRAASNMCWRRMRSLSFILNKGFAYHAVAKIPAQLLRRPKVHFSAQNFAELQFHPSQIEVGDGCARLKLDEHIHVAF